MTIETMLGEIVEAAVARALAKLPSGGPAAEYVDARRAREIFGLDRATLKAASTRGEIVARIVGRKIVYSVGSIRAWLESRPPPKAVRAEPTAEAGPVDGLDALIASGRVTRRGRAA